MSRDVILSVTKLTLSFGGNKVLNTIDLDVDRGQLFAIIGPNGAGKTSFFNVLTRLYDADLGSAIFDDKDLFTLEPSDLAAAGIMRTFQNLLVLKEMSVLDNVMLGPIFRNVGRDEARAQALRWIDRVGLKGFEDRFPHQLSGGMRKRVAVAQSWIVNPRILLMDEPFGALDVQTRQIMETELLGLWQETKKTVLFITHDLEEAIALADKVVVLSAGPARLKGIYDVDLPRPRDVAEIRLSPGFMSLYTRIWADLRDEVKRQYDARQS